MNVNLPMLDDNHTGIIYFFTELQEMSFKPAHEIIYS